MTTTEPLRYRNGDYDVALYPDGTKVRENSLDSLSPDFPESMDVKLTNFCDNTDTGCMAHCHERSNPSGAHGDLALGLEFLSTWQAGCECAFGGGSTLSHPDIVPFLRSVKDIGLVSNATVSAFHTQRQMDLLLSLIGDGLVHGVGCSFASGTDPAALAPLAGATCNLVFHLIAGVNTVGDLRVLVDSFDRPKVLVLGYKRHGNGVGYYGRNGAEVDANIAGWRIGLHAFFGSDFTLSFDNLAIEQLSVRRFFTDADWAEFYQGDDGFASMYCDLVARQCAVSSRAGQRVPLGRGATVKQMFDRVRSTTR